MRLVKMTYLVQYLAIVAIYYSLPFKGRARVGMGSQFRPDMPIPLPEPPRVLRRLSPWKGEEFCKEELIAAELEYLSLEHEIFSQLERVGQLLSGLQRNIKT
jgi:hypothetical protein